MSITKRRGLPYLVLTALFSVILSFIFGNDGFEAFAVLAIAFGVLITWQVVELTNFVFHKKIWLILKIVPALLIGFIWVVLVSIIVLSVSHNVFDPSVPTPNINWIVVILGVLPFLIAQTSEYFHIKTFKNTILGLVISIYSLIIFFLALISYYDKNALLKGFILVFAIQLQYIMSYLVRETKYINWSNKFSKDLTTKFRIGNTDIGEFLHVLITGIPFILPGLIVVLAGLFE